MAHVPARRTRPSKHATPATKRRRKRYTWGGARPGAGRKPSTKKDKSPPHTKRSVFQELTVYHVTMKVLTGLPNLRSDLVVAAIRALLAQAVAEGRLAPVHWSIQVNLFHLVIEADSSALLSKGMQSLAVRIAKLLNRIWKRKGKVFRHRYFARPVTKPDEARRVIRYVLLNRKRHGVKLDAIDPASSGPWFNGWVDRPDPPPGPRPVAAPRTDLLEDFWFCYGGALHAGEQPVGRIYRD